jgi:hypothetical protein
MSDSQMIRYIALFFGILLFVLAGVAVCIGEVWGRFSEVAYRNKDPKQFWSAVATYCLAGIGFIAFYLYKSHALSK